MFNHLSGSSLTNMKEYLEVAELYGDKKDEFLKITNCHTDEDVQKLGICNGDYIAIETKTMITDSGFIKSKMESTLPAPRDGAIRSSPFPVVRECYDRIHPSLETEARDQYAGYVLIQNPSALLQLKSWDEDDDRVKTLLSSSVVAPSPHPHSRCSFSPPSRTSTRCSSSASASHTALSFLVRSTLPRALMT